MELASHFNLNADQELEIYLVVNRLKPATLVEISKKDFLTSPLLGEIFARFYFNSNHLAYSKESRGRKDDLVFNVASSRFNLNLLNNAKNSRDQGLALGYPMEEASLFSLNNNYSNYMAGLIDAKKACVNVPSWLSYLSFVPCSLDLMNARVSGETLRLGCKYQKFVRRTNPKLAERVENDFVDKVDSYVGYNIDSHNNITLVQEFRNK